MMNMSYISAKIPTNDRRDSLSSAMVRPTDESREWPQSVEDSRVNNRRLAANDFTETVVRSQRRRFLSGGLPLIILFLLQMLLLMPAVEAFLLPETSAHLCRSSSFLSMAGKKSGRPGRTGKGKKNQNQPKNKRVKRDSTGTNPKATRSGSQKKRVAVAPPWQVVSKRDMAKNVKAEKERREKAQKGMHQSPQEVENERQYTISSSFLDPAEKSFLAWRPFASGAKHDIEFMGAYLDKRLPPRLGVPEVAFLGRSNVGKSSLLNKLVGSDSARVGKTPGATASVNLYSMTSKEKPILGLVDLPGFGYAKLSKEAKESVQMAAENYLDKRKELVLGILLVDIRRVPSDDDRGVLAALYDMGLPIIVVATKADKIASAEKLNVALEVIQNRLGLPDGQPLCISSVTGQGIKDLWKIIMEACEIGVQEYRDSLDKGSKASKEKEQAEIFDEEEEIAYSQGFDWIHDTPVLYEGDSPQLIDQVHDDNDFKPSEGEGVSQLESIRLLRKKAKDMEKRGEV